MKIICQIVYSTIECDKVLCQANSKELVHIGIRAGFTNYAASYATGLLLARRLLKQLKLEELYKGVNEATGEHFDVNKDLENRRSEGEVIWKRPFKAALDIGVVRSTNGNKVFAAMKGACDGGLHVPHKTRCFPGATKDDKKWKYDASAHRHRIYGGHVADYMDYLQQQSDEAYDRQFSQWSGNAGSLDAMYKGNTVNLEALYKKVHAEIRAKPDAHKKTPLANPVRTHEGIMITTGKGSYPREVRLTDAERKERIKQKIMNAQNAD